MAKSVDLTIDQGSRYQAVISVTVEWLASLAGYTARGKVKPSHTAGGAVLFDFQPYMTVDVPNSLVIVDIPANITAAFSWTSGAYDMEITDGTPAHDVRFLQGTVKVDKEVTA